MTRRTARSITAPFDDDWQRSAEYNEYGDLLGLSTLNTPLTRAALSGLCALSVLFLILPHQLAQNHLRDFVGQADAAHLELNDRMEKDIFFHTFTVKEGKDKPLYVAKIKNIPHAVATQVPLRTDTVKEWRFKELSKSTASTDAVAPTVQSFAHEPRSLRAAFDQVHDIRSLYESTREYQHEKLDAPRASALRFLETTVDNGTAYWIFVDVRDSIETRYYFDAQSHLLTKRRITLLEGGTRFDMAEIIEQGHSFLPGEIAPDIFGTASQAGTSPSFFKKD